MKKPSPIYLYVASVAVPGVALLIITLARGITPEVFGSVQFWLLACAVVIGEFIGVSVSHRKETMRVTIGDPFTLSVLFTFGLPAAMLTKAIASILEDARRGQPWWKSLFNIGQFSLSLATASWTVTRLGYPQGLPPSLETWQIAVALAAGIAYFVVNTTVVTTAIAIAVGRSPIVALRTNVKERVFQYGALLGFAPVVNVAVHESAALFPLLLIPMAIVYYSGQVTQRHIILAQQLSDLYETTRITNTKVGTREAVKRLLQRVCTMFNAGKATITLLPRDGEESSARTTVDMAAGTFTYMEPVDPDPTQGVWARAASESKAILLADPIENPKLRAHFEAGGIKDLMVAPMHIEDVVTGVIEVFNRQGESQTFTSDDLKLFETLANHASISLENARLITALEDSLAHLTEMNRLKDDFVASVSHELRTPLTSIQGYVKTLLRKDVSFTQEDQHSFLETVDRQSARLHRLIEDLLAVSRIESRTDTTRHSIVSLRQITNEVVDEVRNRLSPDQIEIDFHEELLVQTDGGKVHQILANLVDNALKYGGKGKPVVIRGRPDVEGISVAVIDLGPGVPPELQDMVFDRFYQIDQSATRSVGGAGLGLYICRRMAEAIEGRVWLEKTGADGSTFTLWVPISPNKDVAPLIETSEGSWKF